MYDPKVLDVAGVMERLDNDKELLVELVELFLAEAPILISALEDSVSGSDANNMNRSAHTLKGAASNVGAIAVQATAFSLEQLGRDGSVAGAKSQVDLIKNQIEEFRKNFADYQGN